MSLTSAVREAISEVRSLRIVQEYELLARHGNAGVFVLPSEDDPNVWNCVIFPHQGIYKGGVFKCALRFGSEYPFSPPLLHFLGPVPFHPLVSAEDGGVEVVLSFPAKKWDRQRCFVVHLLAWVKSLFYMTLEDVEKALLGGEGGAGFTANINALALLRNDRRAFVTKARQCVRRSLSEVERSPSAFTLS